MSIIPKIKLTLKPVILIPSTRLNSSIKPAKTYNNQTWTFTFSESVENHTGMQIIGQKANNGFSIDELIEAQKKAEASNFQTELIDLQSYLPESLRDEANRASILVIRQGVNLFLDTIRSADQFMVETMASENIVDRLAWMKGRVVNKQARYNLCYADHSQTPDYAKKQGTIVNFKDVPCLQTIREKFPHILGDKAKDLLAELNYYYDTTKCGISFHGDAERRLVVGVRMGTSMPLHYQWFQRFKPIGQRAIVNLNHGDIYIMSDKAVGYDWKKSVIPTLRHATGAEKYVTIKPK